MGIKSFLVCFLLTRVIALPGMVAEANANLRAAQQGAGLAYRAPNADGAAGTRGSGSRSPPGVLRAVGGGSGRRGGDRARDRGASAGERGGAGRVAAA